MHQCIFRPIFIFNNYAYFLDFCAQKFTEFIFLEQLAAMPQLNMQNMFVCFFLSIWRAGRGVGSLRF